MFPTTFSQCCPRQSKFSSRQQDHACKLHTYAPLICYSFWDDPKSEMVSIPKYKGGKGEENFPSRFSQHLPRLLHYFTFLFFLFASSLFIKLCPFFPYKFSLREVLRELKTLPWFRKYLLWGWIYPCFPTRCQEAPAASCLWSHITEKNHLEAAGLLCLQQHY